MTTMPQSSQQHSVDSNQASSDTSSKQLVNLMQDDNKWPVGTALLLWARGKPLAWDLTVSDTCAL